MYLDHVVIAVPDLEQASADYTALGFTVTPGGEHADGRTHNALVAFADGAYLELIAFRPDVETTDHPWRRFASDEGGFADWAVAVDELTNQAKQLATAGLSFGPLREGGRQRPDGVALRWRGTQPQPEHGLPFLIEDITPRPLRVPYDAAVHANGVQGIAGIVVAVPDLEIAATQYARLLDLPLPQPAPDPLLAELTITFPCGSAQITLAAAPAGPLYDYVQRRGAGPYALLLATNGERVGWLDEGLSHGASLRLQPGTRETR